MTVMADNKNKDSIEEPQEEFIDEGIAGNKKAGSKDTEESVFENMEMDELLQKAREKDIDGFASMDKKELIEHLKRSKGKNE